MSEASGARAIHSVHRLAEWRLLAWLLLAGWTVRALLGAGQPQVAAAYLGWLALFGHDPALKVRPQNIAHAKELGLNLVGIDVLQSPPELAGHRAFPTAGTPVPYRAE